MRVHRNRSSGNGGQCGRNVAAVDREDAALLHDFSSRLSGHQESTRPPPTLLTIGDLLLTNYLLFNIWVFAVMGHSTREAAKRHEKTDCH